MMILAFEGGRGLAALLVAIYHLLWSAGYFSVIRNAYLFVDLFFVLSGFLMYSLYAEKLATPGEFKQFLIRRFGRLYPLVVFSTFFYIACEFALFSARYIKTVITDGPAYAAAHVHGYQLPGLVDLVSTLTLTNGVGLIDRLVLNAPTWSISAEFYTYIVFAISCYFLRGKKLIWFLSVSAALMYALTIWGSAQVHGCVSYGKCLDLTYDFGFPRCISTFFLGALSAAFCKTETKFNKNYLQIIGLGLFSFVLATMDRFHVTAFLSPLIFAILVASVSTDEGVLAHILKTRFFQMLGRLSFSIYLMHGCALIFFRAFLDHVGTGWPLYAYTVVYLIFVISMSSFTYRFIENPFRVYFNRIANKYRRVDRIVADGDAITVR
jgi:peptidoglycan/LPS O-acetylase OafA/YrhL